MHLLKKEESILQIWFHNLTKYTSRGVIVESEAPRWPGKRFLGISYWNGTLYKFCTRDKKTFDVCGQLVLQLFAALGTPSTAIAIQQIVRTIALNPTFSIKFFNAAVVPPLLEASVYLEPDDTAIVNQTLEGIFGSEVTLTTIKSYTTAELENRFRAKHSGVIGVVDKRTYQQTPSAWDPVGEDSLSFFPRKSFIRGSSTIFITQNDKVKKNTEEAYEFDNNHGWYTKKEFGRIVDARELFPTNFDKFLGHPAPAIKDPYGDESGWRTAYDEEGRPYYWNTHTRETQWVSPARWREV